MSWVITVNDHVWVGEGMWLPAGANRDAALARWGKRFESRDLALAEAVGLQMRDDMSDLLRGELTLVEL